MSPGMEMSLAGLRALMNVRATFKRKILRAGSRAGKPFDIYTIFYTMK
jgi:hypothetical protein